MGVKMNKYQRTIKFQYYVIKYLDHNKGYVKDLNIFNFTKWLVDIKKRGYIKKSVEFGGTLARIDNITYDDKNDLWGIRFMKLRDTNIPSKVKENEEAEVIPLEDDEYIGEDLNMIYERKSGIAMIQSNRFSLSISKVAEFIQSTISSNDIKILIEPISDKFDKKDIKKRSIKKLEVSFANLINLNESASNIQSLSSIIKPMYKLGGITGSITISLGRTRQKTLNKIEVNQILNEIEENKEYLSTAKIKLRDDDEARTEIIDLLANVAHDYIEFTLETRTALGYEYAINSMIRTFLTSRIRLYKLIGIIRE